MTLERIDKDEPTKICEHPEHHPPQHTVFPTGLYKNTCPACGYVVVFRVRSYPYKYEKEQI